MNAFTKPLIMTLRRQKDVLGGGNERGEQRWVAAPFRLNSLIVPSL